MKTTQKKQQSKKNVQRTLSYILISILSAFATLVIFYLMGSDGTESAYANGYEIGTSIGKHLMIKQPLVKNGIGLGSVIAVLASWERNKSILWSVIHAIFGWLYVIYFLMTRKPQEKNNYSY